MKETFEKIVMAMSQRTEKGICILQAQHFCYLACRSDIESRLEMIVGANKIFFSFSHDLKKFLFFLLKNYSFKGAFSVDKPIQGAINLACNFCSNVYGRISACTSLINKCLIGNPCLHANLPEASDFIFYQDQLQPEPEIRYFGFVHIILISSGLYFQNQGPGKGAMSLTAHDP